MGLRWGVLAWHSMACMPSSRNGGLRGKPKSRFASLGKSVRPCPHFTHIFWVTKTGPTKASCFLSTVASGKSLGWRQNILIRVLVDCCDLQGQPSPKPYTTVQGSGEGGTASLHEVADPTALDAGVSLIGLELQGTAAPANNFTSNTLHHQGKSCNM